MLLQKGASLLGFQSRHLLCAPWSISGSADAQPVMDISFRTLFLFDSECQNVRASGLAA